MIKNDVFTEEDFPQLIHQNNSSKQNGGPEKGHCGWRKPNQKLILTGESSSPSGSVSLQMGGDLCLGDLDLAISERTAG